VNYFSSTESRRAWSRRPPRSPKPKISGFGSFLFLHPRGQGPTPLAALAKRIEASRSESGGVSCSFPYAFSDAFCSRFLRSMAYPRLFFFTRWSVGSSYASMDGWTTTVDPWRVCSGRVVLFSLKYLSIKYIYLFYTIKSKTIRTFLTQIGFIVSLTMDSYVRNEGGETKEDPTKSRIREHFCRKLIFFSHRVLLYPPYIPRVSTFFFLL